MKISQLTIIGAAIAALVVVALLLGAHAIRQRALFFPSHHANTNGLTSRVASDRNGCATQEGARIDNSCDPALTSPT
jgi:hypothetical protein